MVHILGDGNTILNRFVAQVRDRNIQTDSMRFRRNLERIGEVMSYEISKHLKYHSQVVETPLGEVQMKLVSDKVVVASVLRAGLPLQQGVLNYFDDAECAFVSAYRKNKKDGTFKIDVEYVSCGSLEGKVLILVDPTLATGQSLRLIYEALVAHGGEPMHTHIVSVVASEQGVDYAMKHLPSKSTTLWLGAVDAELTSKAYVVPGIGDAGDLCYGKKL
ncbi:MAG: uracil phosphoribosyltransferase [Alistipes sp.]|nr:uracil phosphoribosyltransferase [Alistipes sp.]